MGVVTIRHRGNFNKIKKFLNGASKLDLEGILRPYGEKGVHALSQATPRDSGITSDSWSWEVKRNKASLSLIWYNSNMKHGVPIAILIQYGHATRNGGYIQGRDFINPAIQPIFDDLAQKVWQEVQSL